MNAQRRIGMRFFITYLCIALPFLALSVLVSSLNMRQMRRDVESQLTARLERVATGIDAQFDRYYESSVYLASLPELVPSVMLSSAVNARRGMDRLETVYVFDALVHDLLLVYDEQHLYGSSGLSRVSVYLRKELHLSDDAYAIAADLLARDRHTAACLKTGSTAGYIFLHYPIRMPGNTTLSINYCLDLPAFGELLRGMAGDDDMLISLAFPYGGEVSYRCHEGVIRPLPQAEHQALASQRDWIAASRTTGSMQTHLELRMDERQLYASAARVQYVNIVLLALGMLLSGLLSVTFTNRRLSQLRNLEAAVSGRSVARSNMGEFSNIHTLIQRTLNENVAALSNFRTLLRRQAAQLMFHGLLKDPAECASLLEKCGIELVEDYAFIVGVYADGGDVEPLLEERLYCAAMADGRDVWLYLDELPNLDENRQLRDGKAQRLLRALKASGARTVRLAISAPTAQLAAIDYAYLHTLSDLTRMLEENGREEIVFADDADAAQAHFLPAQDLKDLADALSAFHTARACRLIKRMLQRVAETESAETRQYLRYSMMQPLVRALSESENDLDAALLNSLETIDSGDEAGFGMALIRLTEAFCANNQSEGDGSDMLRYLQDNFRREDLSLDEMAAHFGVSREHMSRLFRARTGIRYIDCITKLRMEAAWEMIASSDVSITEVFHQVGYIDRSSSIKKFKKYFGITPTEVRSQPHAPTAPGQRAAPNPGDRAGAYRDNFADPDEPCDDDAREEDGAER